MCCCNECTYFLTSIPWPAGIGGDIENSNVLAGDEIVGAIGVFTGDDYTNSGSYSPFAPRDGHLLWGGPADPRDTRITLLVKRCKKD